MLELLSERGIQSSPPRHGMDQQQRVVPRCTAATEDHLPDGARVVCYVEGTVHQAAPAAGLNDGAICGRLTVRRGTEVESRESVAILRCAHHVLHPAHLYGTMTPLRDTAVKHVRVLSDPNESEHYSTPPKAHPRS
ncbi:hypothetical protein Vretimale_13483 [Volvox reticuliferus]|uniref:Uncharacterized protein n=1 Tax=Volvox reticuliferus TaxID=1737510 RepID=A0A8J4LTR8_9CHLO|nr:hypothetical protein Vretimale_13483 [Volvox reticuliferus]